MFLQFINHPTLHPCFICFLVFKQYCYHLGWCWEKIFPTHLEGLRINWQKVNKKLNKFYSCAYEEAEEGGERTNLSVQGKLPRPHHIMLPGVDGKVQGSVFFSPSTECLKINLRIPPRAKGSTGILKLCCICGPWVPRKLLRDQLCGKGPPMPLPYFSLKQLSAPLLS